MRARLAVIGLWIGGGLAALAIILHTSFSADMSAFLPRSPSAAQQVLVDQLREGSVSRLVLLAVEGAEPQVLAAVSKAMAGELRANGSFAVVNNGETGAFARDRDILWRNRYLLSPDVDADHFSARALHAALLADAALLNSDSGMLVKRTIPADPTNEMLHLIEGLAGETHPETRDGVWMSRDGSRALLIAQTKAAGFDLNAQAKALAQIGSAFEAARRSVPGASPARLLESGPPVFAVRTRIEMTHDITILSSIATLLVAAILLIAYRSVLVLVLALVPVLTGVIGGIAAVSLGFGFVHGITLGFGVTLIGEAVDYAIYLFTQTEPGAAAADTLRKIWSTLLLGMLTSVCGFSAMLFSSFTGFAQLGLFTIAGLVIALAVTRWVLPALLPARSRFPGATIFAVPLSALMRHARLGRAIVLGLTAAACVVLVSHPGPYWEDELASMSPLPVQEKQLDDQLRRDTGAPDVRYFLAVDAADQEQALLTSERVAAQLARLIDDGLITGFDFPAKFLPAASTQRARQAALPDPATLAANLANAVVGTGFREGAFEPFLTDMAAAARQPLLRRRDLNGTSLGLRVDSLLFSGAHGWTVLLPLRGVTAPEAVAARVAEFAEPGLLFLDLKAESDRLLHSYLREAQTLSIAGGLVIVVLLSVSLRRKRRIAAVLIPLGEAVVCTAAIILAASGVLSVFNLFGLLLVVAVGSNYCLFFEREAFVSDGHTRKHPSVIASLTLANLCTVIGFGVLSFSRFPVLHGIGATVAIGALLCLVFGSVQSDVLAEH